MFSALYIEEEIADHTRVLNLLTKFPRSKAIPIRRYGDIFNLSHQNFRVQKAYPSLILAKKHGRWVLPVPRGYGIGGNNNYYFSHMMNCIYDCRYCYLQGMYRSAANVLFVNFEDMLAAIDEKLEQYPQQAVYFFSGYDCDSLALDPISGFINAVLPFFAERPRAVLELRTKSTQIRSLQNHEPIKNCVVAYSLSPQSIVQRYEEKTPTLEKRLTALARLQQQGWPIGLRFDPLILCPNFRGIYRELFEQVFQTLKADQIHSVSLGSLRLPQHFFKRLVNLYPDSDLFSAAFECDNNGMVAYRKNFADSLHAYCEQLLLTYISPQQYFPCYE